MKNLVRIFYQSDFTINNELPKGYDNEDFIIQLYTTDPLSYYEAKYIDGTAYNCSIADDQVVIYVNNHSLSAGCLHIVQAYDYDNNHFADGIENIKTSEESNIYLVKSNPNSTSAMFTGSALPDLTGASDYVTEADLNEQLAYYVTASQLETMSYVTSDDLNDYLTEEELNDMGYLSQAQLEAMGYATTQYVDSKTGTKQDTLISGVNIKTVNGYSLLGNGNLVIEGGGGGIDLSAYVTHAELNSASYVTKTELSQAGYLTTVPDIYATKTYVENYVSEYAPQVDLSAYVTKTELSQAGYVSQTQLSANSYVSQSQLSQAGYLTAVPDNYATKTYVADYVDTHTGGIDLSSYVTKTELSNAGYATETYVSDYVSQHAPTPDLSAYVTKTELNNAGYVTGSEIASMGYATESYVTNAISGIQPVDLSSYVTKTELNNVGYVTQSTLSNAGYITSIPAEYVTESEIVGMGYVTATELSNMGYITSSDIPSIPSIDESIIPNTTNTYTLGDSSHLYAAAYIPNIKFTGDGRSSISSTNASTLRLAPDDIGFYLDKNGFRPGTNGNKLLGTSSAQWGYTYSANFIENGTNISDKYATKTELSTKQDTLVSGTNIKTVNNNSLLGSGNITITSSGNLIAEVTQAEYDAMVQAGTLDPSTLYVITDAPATDLSYYALKTELTESLIPNTTLAYTLGDSSYLYNDIYVNRINGSATGMWVRLGGNGTVFIGGNSFRPATNNTHLLGTSSNQWAYTYSYNFIENGTNISDKYTTKVEIANASYVTETALSNAAYTPKSYVNTYYVEKTAFIYDSSTYTLTINI